MQVKNLTADKDMVQLAASIVEKCKYIHPSRTEEVEQLLIKLKKHAIATAAQLEKSGASSAGNDRERENDRNRDRDGRDSRGSREKERERERDGDRPKEKRSSTGDRDRDRDRDREGERKSLGSSGRQQQVCSQHLTSLSLLPNSIAFFSFILTHRHYMLYTQYLAVVLQLQNICFVGQKWNIYISIFLHSMYAIFRLSDI
jgi:Kinesin-associated protein (KAP)